MVRDDKLHLDKKKKNESQMKRQSQFVANGIKRKKEWQEVKVEEVGE